MSLVLENNSLDNPAVQSFLTESVIPLRLAVIDPSGWPLVCSLWFLHDEGTIWCATKASASVARYLEKNPKCSFEVAPESMPYRGVRGQGQASLLPDEGLPTLLRLMDRYLGTRESDFAKWLIRNSADEVAIRIELDWLTAWDFTARMQR